MNPQVDPLRVWIVLRTAAQNKSSQAHRKPNFIPGRLAQLVSIACQRSQQAINKLGRLAQLVSKACQRSQQAINKLGRLAQLVERRIYTANVRGSIPLPPTLQQAQNLLDW